MGFLSICGRILLVLVVAIVAFFGWVSTTEIPVGTFFYAVQLPTVWKAVLTGDLTAEVPADLKPLPRPANEEFLDLPGGGKMPASGLGLCCRPTAYHQESVKRTVLWYLLQGGRLLDTVNLLATTNNTNKAQNQQDSMNKAGTFRLSCTSTTRPSVKEWLRLSNEAFLALRSLSPLRCPPICLVPTPPPIGCRACSRNSTWTMSTLCCSMPHGIFLLCSFSLLSASLSFSQTKSNLKMAF